MKKSRKSSKKGFTLVELIVVLVILAILAAMLVPALTGYIKRAREEKNYQFASTVLTASQAAATYQYSIDKNPNITQATRTGAGSAATVAQLVGNSTPAWSCNFAVSNGVITSGDVKIDGVTYHWDASSVQWTAKK